MKDKEQGHIIATCSSCGFRFDVLFGISCPACRTESVKKAFAPVDALRTALGMPGSFRVTKEGYVIPLDGNLSDYLGDTHGDTEDTPAGCRIPADDKAQVYELRRRFRL
jgi:hypothetical protein